jgi:hypothetical protein
VPAVRRGATLLQRLAWQIGLFFAALDRAAQRHPDWLVVCHEDLCAEQPTNWTRHLSPAQVDEVVGVLSTFPDRLFGRTSVP